MIIFTIFYALHGCYLKIACYQPTKVSDICSSIYVQVLLRGSTVVLLCKFIVGGLQTEIFSLLRNTNQRVDLSVCKRINVAKGKEQCGFHYCLYVENKEHWMILRYLLK